MQRRVLITGATGCAGPHLGELALAKGARVFGFARRDAFARGVEGRAGDITDSARVEEWIAECRPDRVFHLAGLVHGRGAHSREEYCKVNIEGTIHLLEAVQKIVPGARVLVAGSSGIYGQPEPWRPIAEDTPAQPGSPYAVSKAAQEIAAKEFFTKQGLAVVRTRVFNQTGPREPEGLVCASLACQVARIEAGLQEPVLRAVTLGTSRDFCDVRDVVAGYWAAMEHGAPGEAYNVCSGHATSIARVVEILLGHSSSGDV
ncbi:MAG TPA: GDP-mannose 4,6-dehydratase, partial [Chthoniobacteraceae bacterium]|nr:GDP-mannose 4,6-dehydratase [Chthoniobacteraceae bacterium]